MITPVFQNEALLQDIANASSDRRFAHFWWLGQSGYLVKWREQLLLIDPYLSDSLTVKYAGTKTEHVRMTARCLSPVQLGFVPLVLSSHTHTDHLDAETLVPLAAAVRKNESCLRLLASSANASTILQKLGDADLELIPLNVGVEWKWDDLSISLIPSAHTELKQDAAGQHFFVGFILRLDSLVIYHSGDTVLYPGLVDELVTRHPDVMLLPINGNRPERGVAGNLNGTEAAQLAKAVKARLVIPHHYDMFTFNTVSPDEFVRECKRQDQPYRLLQCGERLTLDVPSRF